MVSENSSGRLSVARLMLTDFRNFKHATINLAPQCVVLTGPNGSGKTNLLEAVSLLAPGRGMRGAVIHDMARHDGSGVWSIAARVASGGRELAIGTGKLAEYAVSKKNGGRTVRIDGETVSSSSRLGETVAAIWLMPAMEGLFTGPASDRRKFLDRLTSACNPSHRSLLARFDLAMRQRNRLLESGASNARIFASYERQMAETGVAIAAARVETIDRLDVLIETRQRSASSMPFPWATVAVAGTLETAVRQRPAIAIEDDYAALLAASRERDRASGRTIDGPHAADFIVGFGPKQMPARLCSTGEQKALLIGLILAQADLIKSSRHGQAPLILLDEIAAHLDEGRREALFQEIMRLDSQAWMTGTDHAAFSPLGENAQFFNVSAGIATPRHVQPNASHLNRQSRNKQRMRAS